MAARRLVLNGLTAQVEGDAGAGAGAGSPDSLEFYHELELYRQLLALPAPPAPPAPPPVLPARRARTPDPAPPRTIHEWSARRSRTPAPHARAPAAAPHSPSPRPMPARYLGSFLVNGAGSGVEGGAGSGAGSGDGSAEVADQLRLMKESGRAEPVLVVVALSGLAVCDPTDQSVRMRYALRRILYATCESVRALFAVVAREPRVVPPRAYCHAFETDSPDQAEELNSLLGDAFRMAFASQLHPSAPLWCKEVSGGEGGAGPRAPDSLPLGAHAHYPPRHNRSAAKCGLCPVESESSPSSSEEWNSPTEVSCYRRLGAGAGAAGERPPLMRRLARGFSGALLHPSDDDSTPLVADTPTTPTNLPLCMNGYINEASEAEARTRESNRDHLPVLLPPTPRRHDNSHDVDDFRRCTNLKNSPGGACSRTTSSSSGASSCGGSCGGAGRAGGAGSCGSGNNNYPRAEPDLRHAPWFQHGIPREIALEVLSGQCVGAFLVRGSTTQAGCFALSVRVPRDFAHSGIAHYLILPTQKGYKIKGFTKEFRSLCALVTHHSVMPELLPVPLQLPAGNTAGGAAGGAAGGGRARADHADIDSVAPPPPPARHAPPHHLPSFLKQLDV